MRMVFCEIGDSYTVRALIYQPLLSKTVLRHISAENAVCAWHVFHFVADCAQLFENRAPALARDGASGADGAVANVNF